MPWQANDPVFLSPRSSVSHTYELLRSKPIDAELPVEHIHLKSSRGGFVVNGSSKIYMHSGEVSTSRMQSEDINQAGRVANLRKIDDMYLQARESKLRVEDTSSSAMESGSTPPRIRSSPSGLNSLSHAGSSLGGSPFGNCSHHLQGPGGQNASTEHVRTRPNVALARKKVGELIEQVRHAEKVSMGKDEVELMGDLSPRILAHHVFERTGQGSVHSAPRDTQLFQPCRDIAYAAIQVLNGDRGRRSGLATQSEFRTDRSNRHQEEQRQQQHPQLAGPRKVDLDNEVRISEIWNLCCPVLPF